MAEIVNFKVFEAVNQNTGEPVFPMNQTMTEVNAKIQSFEENDSFALGPSDTFDSLSLDSDILVVREKNAAETLTSFETYKRIDEFSTNMLLRYNYNMSTASVDVVFSEVLNNITKELRPPDQTTFTYDFKFCENQNGRVTTGSSRPPRRRRASRASTGGGGGY